MIFRYPLTSEKKRAKAEQLLDNIYYLSEQVAAVRLHAEYVEVDYTGEEDAETFQARLDRYMRVGLLAKFAAKQVPYDNRSTQKQTPARAAAALSPHGGLALQGCEVILAQALDHMFMEMAVQAGAQLRKYPSIVTAAQMEHGGYLTHFPQHMYAISEVAHNEERLRMYREQSAEQKHAGGLLQPNGFYLQPCLCFHVYEELAHTDTDAAIGDLAVYSAAGTCYRHEHLSRISQTRLREFMMREIIYVGDAERVVQMRESLMRRSWELFEQLGLRGYVESAADPFFYEEDSVLMYQQSAHALKFELRCAGVEGQEFSIASFNLCGHVLCDAFGVKSSHGELHSGCTGFGIDRWVQALLHVYGRETHNWPMQIQSYVQADAH